MDQIPEGWLGRGIPGEWRLSRVDKRDEERDGVVSPLPACIVSRVDINVFPEGGHPCREVDFTESLWETFPGDSNRLRCKVSILSNKSNDC